MHVGVVVFALQIQDRLTQTDGVIRQVAVFEERIHHPVVFRRFGHDRNAVADQRADRVNSGTRDLLTVIAQLIVIFACRIRIQCAIRQCRVRTVLIQHNHAGRRIEHVVAENQIRVQIDQ